jgi:hypothetical protein
MLYISSDFHHAGSHVDNNPAPEFLQVKDTGLFFCSNQHLRSCLFAGSGNPSMKGFRLTSI